MAQIMPQPSRRPESRAYDYRKVVPTPLRAVFGRTEVHLCTRVSTLRSTPQYESAS